MTDELAEKAVKAATGMTFETAQDVVAWVSTHSLSEHPLLQRIAETNETGLLWLLIHNTYRGTSVNFAAWLASVTATVEDERARSLLARQLNEEMGDGNVERAHSRLMTGFLSAIDPLRPANVSQALTEPGEVLGQELAQLYLSRSPYRALAALMAGEVCAHQIIASVGQLLTPHLPILDRGKLTWLTHHNEVEGSHADESTELAAFVPSEASALREVVVGALGVHGSLWESMNTLLLRWAAIHPLSEPRSQLLAHGPALVQRARRLVSLFRAAR
jgi:pyrroloquinoline quinone (PQQ) biosynthesis protein C